MAEVRTAPTREGPPQPLEKVTRFNFKVTPELGHKAPPEAEEEGVELFFRRLEAALDELERKTNHRKEVTACPIANSG